MDTIFEELIAPLKFFLEQQGTEITRKQAVESCFLLISVEH